MAAPESSGNVERIWAASSSADWTAAACAAAPRGGRDRTSAAGWGGVLATASAAEEGAEALAWSAGARGGACALLLGAGAAAALGAALACAAASARSTRSKGRWAPISPCELSRVVCQRRDISPSSDAPSGSDGADGESGAK